MGLSVGEINSPNAVGDKGISNSLREVHISRNKIMDFTLIKTIESNYNINLNSAYRYL